MHTLATGTSAPLSTAQIGLLAAWMMAGCGWSIGRGPTASWSVGAIRGATVEPGLEQRLSQQLSIERARRRVQSGPALDLTVEDLVQVPTASQQGQVAWRTELTVSAALNGRPDCAVQGRGSQVWVASQAGGGAEGERRAAVDAAIAQVSVQIVDALLARPECR